MHRYLKLFFRYLKGEISQVYNTESIFDNKYFNKLMHLHKTANKSLFFNIFVLLCLTVIVYFKIRLLKVLKQICFFQVK